MIGLGTLANMALIMAGSAIGSVLIFGIGINMIFGKRIKVGNLLPTVLVRLYMS